MRAQGRLVTEPLVLAELRDFVRARIKELVNRRPPLAPGRSREDTGAYDAYTLVLKQIEEMAKR